MCKIAVFAGTSEGRELIERLSGRGTEITAYVATEYGRVVLGEHEGVRVRAGALLRADMPGEFSRRGYDLVVDATHPYADHVTESIRLSCEAEGVEYLRLQRRSTAGAEDGVFVSSAEECAAFLRSTQGNILLTTGSRTLSVFCADEKLRQRLFARVLPVAASLEECARCGLPAGRIIAMQGPFDEELNAALLRAADARYLVTKDSGVPGGYEEKIRAARRTGATAVIIGRPAQQPGMSTEEVLALIQARFALSPERKRVTLCGVGMGDESTRTLGLLRALESAECVIGAPRLLESVDTAGRETFTAVRAGEIAGYIRASSARRFLVLFSGDTGFYSGAKALLRQLEDMDTALLPGVGSLSYLCARLGRPWEDVRAVSLHGRDCDLAGEARRSAAVFALLGGEDGAVRALESLCAAGLGELSVHVGERLGYPEEKITSGTTKALREKRFDPLSVLLVENPRWGESAVTPGIPDEAFQRGGVPMTKSEVRSVILGKLALGQESVVYDVGAGTGSVSVECARLLRAGKVYAIEKNEEAVALTQRNAEKFGLANITVVPGAAPEALEDLPAPTHAFIGGSAGGLRQIVDALVRKNPRVRIVAAAVTLETVSQLSELAKDFAFSETVQVHVSRAAPAGRYHLLTAQNPVFVCTLQNP